MKRGIFKTRSEGYKPSLMQRLLLAAVVCTFSISAIVGQAHAQEAEWIDEVGIYWLLNGSCHMFYPDSGGAYRLDEPVSFEDEERIHVQGPVVPFPDGMVHLCGSMDLIDVSEGIVELETPQAEIIDEIGIYWLISTACHMFYPDSGGAYRLDEPVNYADETRIRVQGPVLPFPEGLVHLCGPSDLVDVSESTIEPLQPVCVYSYDTDCHRCCNYDVTGPNLKLDHLVTEGNVKQWWNDDAYACYMVSEDYGQYPQYAPFFPACDKNGSGTIDIYDVNAVYSAIGTCDGTCG